jgi:ArsR family transcriptional regulator
MYEGTMTATRTKTMKKAARLFHALSDETRVGILERLRDGEQCVCDLTEAFNTGQSRLSFHLRVLKDAGLVIDRPEGRWIYYSINQDAIQELDDFITWLKESRPMASKPAVPCG